MKFERKTINRSGMEIPKNKGMDLGREILIELTNHTQQDKTHSKKLSVEKSEKAGDVASFEKQDISCKGEHLSSEMTAHLPTSVRDKPADTRKGCGAEIKYKYSNTPNGEIKEKELGKCGDKKGFPNGDKVFLCDKCKKEKT